MHHRNLHPPSTPPPPTPQASQNGDVAIPGPGLGNHCLNSCHFSLSQKLINTSRISSPPCPPQLWREAHTAAWERRGRPQRKHRQRKYRTRRDGTCAIPGFFHPGFHSWLGEASGASDRCLGTRQPENPAGLGLCWEVRSQYLFIYLFEKNLLNPCWDNYA